MVMSLPHGYLASEWQSWAEDTSSGFELPGGKSGLYHLLVT